MLDLFHDEAPANLEEKERRCLKCGESFKSTWAGERICNRCRQTVAWRNG